MCRALRLFCPAFEQPGGRARGPLVPSASRQASPANVFYSVPRAFLRLSQPSPLSSADRVNRRAASGRLGLSTTMRFPELVVKPLFAPVTRRITRTRR